MSTPANHPPSCSVCHGTGWQPGPDIETVANGDVVHYSSVEPCTHHWSNDAPSRARAMTLAEYRAALERRGEQQQLLTFDRNKDRWTL
jgi:hypothetical protein